MRTRWVIAAATIFVAIGMLAGIQQPVTAAPGRPIAEMISRAELARLLPGLSPTHLEELLRSGSVGLEYTEWRDVQLAPRHPMAEVALRELRAVRPNLASERLMIVPVRRDPRTDLMLYNALRRISQLTEVLFHEPGWNRSWQLYLTSQAIMSANNPQPVPDPLVRTIPRESQITVVQDMPPFGDVISEYRFRSEGAGFHYNSANITALSHSGLRVVRPGNMRMHIVVIPTDDFLLVYGVGAVRVFTLFGLLDDRVKTAFIGRVGAFFDWYNEEYLLKLR